MAAGLEGCGRRFVGAEFVVPAVDLRGAAIAAEAEFGGGNVDQLVLGCDAAVAAGRPGGVRPDVLQLMLADQHRRGFEVDALVFDAHQDDPERVVPADRQGQRLRADQAVDGGACRPAVFAHRGDGRPVVAGVVEVVPAHFVDADGEHRFVAGVDALDQPGQRQLVDEEGGGVAEVEDQRMAQRDRFDVVRLVAGQRLEQQLVAVEGGMEIIEDLLALLLRVGAGEQRRAGEGRWFHADRASSSAAPTARPR